MGSLFREGSSPSSSLSSSSLKSLEPCPFPRCGLEEMTSIESCGSTNRLKNFETTVYSFRFLVFPCPFSPHF